MRLAFLAFLLLPLAACQSGTGVDDPYTGCYDNSCSGAPLRVPVVPPLASLTAIGSHTCGISTSGDAWCWGDNSFGQLGDGSDLPRSAPVAVTGGHRFSALAAGATFTCGVALDGTAWCWGGGPSGQLGQPAPERCGTSQAGCSRTPIALAGHGYVAIAAGLRHACALDTAGAAWCWGFNFIGEAGSTAYGETVAAPTRVPGGNAFASIGAGDTFTCALTTAGRAMCWGSGDRGELGRAVPVCISVAGFDVSCSATPVTVGPGTAFTSLSVGSSHSCAITPGGVAHCWGDNGQGQLGTGDFVNGGPVVAQGGATWASMLANGPATCGTPMDGPSECWGLNLFGLLGAASRIDLSTTPLPIAGGRRYVAWSGGADHVCALTADGAAWCWGAGREGQLGSGPMLP